MTHQARSTAAGMFVRQLLPAAVVGLALASPASFAQAPASPTMVSSAAPLEAYTDPGWTGKPQPPAVLRKEAAAALAEGRQRCAREPTPQARQECLTVVTADHRLMLSRLENRRAAR